MSKPPYNHLKTLKRRLAHLYTLPRLSYEKAEIAAIEWALPILEEDVKFHSELHKAEIKQMYEESGLTRG